MMDIEAFFSHIKDAENGGRELMSILVKDYGVTKDGEQVKQYILENANGVKAVLLNYGAVVSELHVPDKEGKLRDVVWGYEKLEGYEVNAPNLGAVIGRNANRTGGAQVTIAGKTYELQKNEGNNNLHGGEPAYGRRVWKAVIVNDNQVEFSLFSPDGDQVFPGNAEIKVSYTLSDDNELLLTYTGKADQDTVFNLTNHSYFNLDGEESDSVLDQIVWIDADAYTPADSGLIPTGEIRSVEGTPLDFRTPTAIGARINEAHESLQAGKGYDLNYVLKDEGAYTLCASMYSKESGIRMEVRTDAPGMQFYTSNFLEEKGGKNGREYGVRSAACFEAHYFPDATHHENFKSTIVKAGDTYHLKAGYKFSVEK